MKEKTNLIELPRFLILSAIVAAFVFAGLICWAAQVIYQKVH